ncbi:hypothetical protein QFC21_006421 [Naganishia friedmannii]|uniref:Uncharacterized protein n=1 Tax=Naganishia friedmannii TaxID=89922 RepID=A0ACC2V3G7_9TREE|nr:hypothetical protein QFC21_006421 [Naganishia friedmannii]
MKELGYVRGLDGEFHPRMVTLGGDHTINKIGHGTFFWHAYEAGYIKPNSSIHAGVRTRFTGPTDLDDDVTAGFELIHAFDIDDLGVPEVVRRIKRRIGDSPVMISLDVDVMDPSTAPASKIIQSLQGLNVVAFDIVELSPAYDTNAEISAIAAADCAYDFLCLYALGTDAKLIQEEEDMVVRSTSHNEL